MTAAAGAPAPPDLPDAALARLVGEILRADHGLVMCMGKGGVGKTTIAAAIAVALAQAGREVHLTTTDPAAHLTGTLHGTVAGLQVSRIDPVAAVQAYRDHVMATKGKDVHQRRPPRGAFPPATRCQRGRADPAGERHSRQDRPRLPPRHQTHRGETPRRTGQSHPPARLSN
jgi:hypothetical protein